MGRYLQYLVQLVLSPTKGWVDIAMHPVSVDRLRTRGAFPLMALACVTVLAQLFYHPHLGISLIILQMAAIGVALFGGFFIANTSNRIFMVRFCSEPDIERCDRVVCYGYGLLALSYLVCNLLPVSVGLPVLLPIGVGLVLCKSQSYLGVDPEQELHFTLYEFASAILPPMVVYLLFDGI